MLRWVEDLRLVLQQQKWFKTEKDNVFISDTL